MELTGAQIVLECLLEQKVDTVFGYPGGTILNIYDALTTGAPLKVKLSQIRRQIAIIEECHRQNPLPKFVKVPEGTL